MSRIRANELAALRRAAEQYEDIKRVVAQVVSANPQGLQIRPLFGQRPRVARRLKRAA